MSAYYPDSKQSPEENQHRRHQPNRAQSGRRTFAWYKPLEKKTKPNTSNKLTEDRIFIGNLSSRGYLINMVRKSDGLMADDDQKETVDSRYLMEVERLDRRLDFEEVKKIRALLLDEYGTVTPKFEALLNEMAADVSGDAAGKPNSFWADRINSQREPAIEMPENSTVSPEHGKLPTELPKKYRKYAEFRLQYEKKYGVREAPKQFLIEEWGKYIEAGLIYQSTIRGYYKDGVKYRGLDRTLFNYIRDSCETTEELSIFLPTLSVNIDNTIKKMENDGININAISSISASYRRRNNVNEKF